jgi:parallel beta-helix repeat protein
MPLIWFEVKQNGATIEHFLIENVNIGILVAANDVHIKYGLIRRLWSNGGNGSGIVVAAGASNCWIEDVEIDGRESVSESGGIHLASGSSYARVIDCHIHHHPHVGLSIGSTTYADFPYTLPASYGHHIERNVIEFCGKGPVGDVSAGTAIVGQSHGMVLKDNLYRYNKGPGITVSGSAPTDGVLAGTPKLIESPTGVRLEDNAVSYNGEEGIRITGANAPQIIRNVATENSQRGQSLYKNYRYAAIAPGADLRDMVTKDNESYGTMPLPDSA